MFCVFDNMNDAESFLNYLNSQHSNIKLTMENEEKNQLPFLDVLVSANENGFIKSLFQKKTYTY